MGGDHQLGADAVRPGDKHWIFEAGGLEVEHGAETAEVGCDAGAVGRCSERFYGGNQIVAGIDVDA